MRRTQLLVAVVVAGALAACTGGGSGGSAGSGGIGAASASRSGSTASASSGASATASPSPTAPATVITNLEALQAITAYNRANSKAANARSEKAARAIQTGPLLATTLADFRYTKRAGKKPIRALAMSSPGAIVPATDGQGRWFVATTYSQKYQANYVSLFEQNRAGTPWRKSLEVWLSGSPFPDPAVSSSGAAELADHAGAVRDGAALKAVARYLSTGKKAKAMRVGPASYVRSYLHKLETTLTHARSSLKCAPSRGARVAGLATNQGTEVVASLDCSLSQQADPNWRIELKERLKALSNRSSNLRSVNIRSVVQVAFTVSRTGATRVLGTTYSSVAVTAH